MLGHIANVRQALRFAVSDFHGDELPGFCLPGKVRISKMRERNECCLEVSMSCKMSCKIGINYLCHKRCTLE